MLLRLVVVSLAVLTVGFSPSSETPQASLAAAGASPPAALMLPTPPPIPVPAQGCVYNLPGEIINGFGAAIERRLWPHVPQMAADTAARNGATVTYRWNGYGDTRVDVHWIEVESLPADPNEDYLLYLMANDYNSLFGEYSEFLSWVGWAPAMNPQFGRQVGEGVRLNIWGPDNGWVVYTELPGPNPYFAVVTADDSRFIGQAGSHPVSGTREWGYVRTREGRTFFYTVGVEAASTAMSGTVGSELQIDTWNAWARDLARVIDYYGGTVYDIEPRYRYVWLEQMWVDQVDLSRQRSANSRQAVADVLMTLGFCVADATDPRPDPTPDPWPDPLPDPAPRSYVSGIWKRTSDGTVMDISERGGRLIGSLVELSGRTRGNGYTVDQEVLWIVQQENEARYRVQVLRFVGSFGVRDYYRGDSVLEIRNDAMTLDGEAWTRVR